ncbi:hypothetical protein [Paenisporosarcina indica]|uniref:hypothetical protein n=1 Tax=Paenisporosarcina indica TaxID=650093 RepID=UPI00094FDB9C|nr:hypothetical protein [Paenisporosarcina indica]
MLKLNYGKYFIPEKLVKVIDLQAQLNKQGLLDYGDLLGLYFSYDGLDSRYLNTPLDVISFARPGVDGIHYGFLTDFGQVKDLDNAYIVRVSPMDFDAPVKIVARNIYDFMRIMCFSPVALELVDINTSKKEFEQLLQEYPELSTIEMIIGEENKVRDIFCETFQLEPIESLYDYLRGVKQERENEIVLSTEDGIGVVNNRVNEKEINNKDLFKFNEEHDLQIIEVKYFFVHSSFATKLVFLRDALSKGLIFDQKEVKVYLIEQLRFMHLSDEAERISYPE